MEKAYETFCVQARKLNGSLSVYDVDGDKKKLIRKTSMKADPPRLLLSEVLGQRFSYAYVYRTFGDTKQALILENHERLNKPRLRNEYYRKASDPEPNFPIEAWRTFAFDAPCTQALRPTPQWRFTFLDLLDYPAVQITGMEKLKKDNVSIVKISYQVDEAVNKKQPDDLQIYGIQKGWINFRPDQMWTIEKAEVVLVEVERRKPPRLVTWNADFTYAPAAANVIPMLQAVSWTTVESKDKPDQKPKKQLFEMDFKMISAALPDEEFSLKQFNLEDRTVEAWTRDETERLRKEAEEKAKIAAIPPEKLKPASYGLVISPWMWLVCGLALFFVVILSVYQSTSRKKPQVT